MINSGDTAWVLVCAALVLFMVPGLAIFYGGMDRRGNVLAMLQQNIIPLGVISITWVLIGYTLAFGNDTGGGLIGNLELFAMQNLDNAPLPAMHVVDPAVAIPTLAFVAYSMMFAIITPALITGATAGRLKFSGWVVFLLVWSIVVYPPVAHWLFNPSGWLAQLGAQDWAGGIVVHTAAGAATLAVLAVVGRRRNWPNVGSSPHNLPLTILGAGILWFGWFGFNAGDGLAANGIAAQAFMNTTIAASAGMLFWLLVEWRAEGHPTVLGAVTGAVAGLATITPCAGYVSTLSAVAIGGIAGLVCHLALRLKFRFHFDDALDVIGVHFVGGILGSLLLGFFAESSINSASANGLLYGGGINLLAFQALAVVVVAVFSFCVSWLIAIAIEKTIKLRETDENQANLDLVQQGMSAYAIDKASAIKVPAGAHAKVGAQTPAQKAPVTGTQRLVTTFATESSDFTEFKQAVLDAGASTIMASEALIYTGETRAEVFRGQSKQIEFHPHIRTEVIVAEQSVDRVLQEFAKFTPGSPVFIEAVESAQVPSTAKPG